jgi:hypothetical protein
MNDNKSKPIPNLGDLIKFKLDFDAPWVVHVTGFGIVKEVDQRQEGVFCIVRAYGNGNLSYISISCTLDQITGILTIDPTAPPDEIRAIAAREFGETS